MTGSGLGPDDASPDARKEGPPPAALSALLGAMTGRREWRRRLEGARIHEHWPAIAGEQLARHSEPVRLHGGVLVLRASTAAWATQVRYLSAELVQRANDVLGPDSVSQVQIVTGHLRGLQGPENAH